MERHPAMFDNNYMDACLPRQNGDAMNLLTRFKHTGPSAPPPEPAAPASGLPPPPGTTPVPPGDCDGHGSDEIQGMPSQCVYIHSPLPNTQFFNHNASAKDCKYDKDFISDLLCTLSAAWKYH
jgi:hypothetical protein